MVKRVISFFSAKKEMMVPGGSSARVELFDANAKEMKSWSFPTGWRVTFDSASIEYSNDLGSNLIVFHMIRFINGRDIAKEYFAIDNDQLKFVRMEDAKGDAVQNDYLFPNVEIGVVPGVTSPSQWAGLLESTHQADVLSALMFFGGKHLPDTQRTGIGGPENGMYGEVFQELLGSPRIRELIESLSHSENEWIRQAALLAARAPRDR
jgi:hypothetical protein